MDSTAHRFQTVDEYLSSLPAKVKAVAEELRAIIKEEAPEAVEVISYNMPAFKLKGVLVYYAAWKEHLGLYGATAKLTEVFKEDLKDYDTAKGTIRFPLNKALPIALIRRLVRYRVKENLEKASAAKKKKQ